ncbi:ketopantoate reductase family protein [Rhizobium sp. TH2]|uniref:ketopantoate reductase family protein n=1 Tax=Rhizobium sp. TH2 TaxID=2775403 RepID=UPI00280B371C|nr:ketopantoate reductase family protein [Rhizobium sp. TH2]
MGAGAVGCYYGAVLARAGHNVTLVGRQAFVDRVTTYGLRLEAADFNDIVPVTPSTDAASLAEADIVLFSVKSGDTDEAGRSLAPHLKPDATVFTFQNGVDNAERLQAILQRPVIAAAVYVAAEIVGPGHVKHNGRGDIVIGVSPAGNRIAETFRAAGIPVTISDNVNAALWSKLILNCAYNALSAAAQVPYGPMMETGGVRDVMADVVRECVTVGRAMGLDIQDPDMETLFGLARSMPNQYSSTAQDLAAGKPTEIDYLNGFIVRKGRELGIATPANRVLQVIVKLLESRNGARSIPSAHRP